ncbi:ATP-binding protein [Shewanella cutis]|uniref:histidine kinase n=1 Tax=Shewanella cutis TaxID=2766780 RepID=A0ABS9R104_9GAMM|nr:transporter substrate-binding domain-containing protein [Shewanella sp. PS-2]MCG9966229.1 transporter substrate-binding domain-containing protein [Shewanella sp. PS-2]
MRSFILFKIIYVLAIYLLVLSPSVGLAHNKNTYILKGHPNLEATKLEITPAEEIYLQSFKELKVAITEPNFHPYDFIDNESFFYQGISADYLNLIKESLNLNIKIIRFEKREDAINAVKTGEADILTTANSYENNNGLQLSIPYLTDRPALFKNVSLNSEIKTISMAYDYLANSAVQKYFPDKTIVNYPSKQAAVAAAAFGKADAVIIDLLSANYMINNTFYKKLQLDSYIDIDSKGIAFASIQKHHQLLDILNKAIENISKEKSRLVRERWSGGGNVIPERNELPEFNKEEKDWIEKNKKIFVVINEYMAPLSYVNSNGVPAGYAIEILDLIRLYTGLNIEYVTTKSFKEQKNMVLKSKEPYITVLSPSKSRANLFNFSSEFSSSPYIIVQRKNAQSINNPTIAIPNGHAIEDYVKNSFLFKDIKLKPNFIESLDSVKNNEADYTIIPLNIADYYNQSYFSDFLEIKDFAKNIPNASANFSLKKNDKILLSIINKALLSIPPNELQILENYWRSNSIPAKQTWKDYRYTIYTISIFSLLLVFVSVAWVIYTRKHYLQRLNAAQQLDKQLLFMQQIVDAIPHPIYARDKNLSLVLCNESYASIFNSTRDELLNSSAKINDLRINDRVNIEQEYIDCLNTGKARFQDRNMIINNAEFTTYNWIKPYCDLQNNIEGIVGGWIDISERIKLLEDLKHAKNLAESASAAKSTFLATMSHEIRTPMNAIIGMLELALKSSKLPISELNTIKVAYDSANGLLELIGDILDIARIEAGQLTLSPVRTNLKSIVASVVRVFEGLAHQKGLTLELNFDTHINKDVLVDPMRIKQILSNLIGNAIKFTNEGNVKITVNSKNNNDKCCFFFTVTDTGIGISQEDQLKIFTAFSQGNDSHKNYGGTGLGLMISRSLCEMMGGTLKLKSELNAGTEVRMELCLTLLEDATELIEKQLTTNLNLEQCFNILVVDDHPANRLLLAQQLRFLGHNVTDSDNGKSAIKLFKDNEFQFIITDCNMPEMNGYELSKNIRKLEKHIKSKSSIIIGYTANAQKEIMDACIAAGMNDCLFKPISLQELNNTLIKYSRTLGKSNIDLSFTPEVVQHLTGNDDALTLKLLLELIKSNKSDRDILIQARKNSEHQKIRDITHKIKGAAKIIDARDLVMCCEKIEGSSNQSIEKDITPLLNALDKLDNEIASYVKNNGAVL